MRLVLLLVAIGCASSRPRSEAPSTEPAPFEGTVGETRVERTVPVATVTDVRTGGHEGYDRVVFELSEGIPGYHVAYVDRPQHRCGSGEPVYLDGDAWLEVRLHPARMHTEAGEPTVADRSRAVDLGNLVALESTCDFEAYVTWVIAVRSPEPYRVIELSDPPRLVIDVGQPSSSS